MSLFDFLLKHIRYPLRILGNWGFGRRLTLTHQTQQTQDMLPFIPKKRVPNFPKSQKGAGVARLALGSRSLRQFRLNVNIGVGLKCRGDRLSDDMFGMLQIVVSHIGLALDIHPQPVGFAEPDDELAFP